MEEFLSSFQHTLDSKGRVILPAGFRERLSMGLIMTRGLDPCVDLWPRAKYQDRLAQARSLPRESRRARRQMRLLTAGGHPGTPDSQGRIVVPADLREYARLVRDLVVCGTDDHVEIWDRDTYYAEFAAAEADLADLDEPIGFPS